MLFSRTQLLPITLSDVPGLCEYATLNSGLTIKKTKRCIFKNTQN